MSKGNNSQEKPGAEFFRRPFIPAQRQYEALRAYLLEGLSATEAAEQFGYTSATLYALWRDFRLGRLTFFSPQKPGSKGAPKRDAARERVFQLRQQNYSVYDILKVLASEGLTLSHTASTTSCAKQDWQNCPDAVTTNVPWSFSPTAPSPLMSVHLTGPSGSPLKPRPVVCSSLSRP